MERLTKRWGANHAVPTKINLDFIFDLDDATSQGLTDIFDRLAAYEGTGLEPEEARKLAVAKEDGRLVVQPFKVGDTVYRVVKKKKYLNNPKNTMYLKEIVIKPENAHKYITEIGKTVFLTSEEAVAALGAKKGEKNMRPIPFITTMVQAVRDERKSVIRMICEDGNDYTVPDIRFLDSEKRTYAVHNYADKEHSEKLSTVERTCPICHGDILYVQEEWRAKEAGYPPPYSIIEYKAGGEEKFDDIVAIPTAEGEWKPAIEMPEEAARLLLLVKAVRAERLQEITAEDALKECGVSERPYFMYETVGQLEAYARKRFKELWDSAIPKDKLRIYGWEANPWVWVINFERISKEASKGEGYETI